MKANCNKCLQKNVCIHYKAKQNDNYAYMGCKFDYENCSDFLDEELNIKLPCKVGDMVYVNKRTLCNWYTYFDFKSYIKCKVIGIKLVGKKKEINLKPITERTYGSRYHRFYSFTAIGKTVFLTEKEALKALEGKE